MTFAPWRIVRKRKTEPDDLTLWGEIDAPPVPVEALCKRLGVVIRRVHNPGWDSALTIDSEAMIWVDSSVYGTRQRFAIAHQLGHLVLHDGTVFRDRITLHSPDPKELEANRYAAAVLMPTWMIHAFERGKTTEELADLFEVSPQAMEIRRKRMRRVGVL